MGAAQCILPLLSFTSLLLVFQASAQLSSSFYDKSCPGVVPIVRGVLQKAVQREARIAASLLRLHFHDCFVNGCDGSVLLDDTASFTGEKTAVPNNRSARGFEVVDNVKVAVEKSCPGVVSCADILAIIAREGVVLMNGPTWTLQLGRRDSTTASRSSANNDIPPPNSTLSQLISKYQAKGLNVQELVVLSGAHTIGQARCFNFRDRLYNFSNTGKPDSTLDATYLSSLRKKCPRSGGDDITSPLDLQSPTGFDNSYFHNIRGNTGLLNSDEVLYGGAARRFVAAYDGNQAAFFKDFAAAMVKMGNISPLTGSRGQIRRNCRRVN